MIIVAGSARLHADRRDEAIEIGLKMAADSQAESGCIAYRISGDLADPAIFYITEVWESEDALRFHFGTEHFQAFARFLSTALDGEGVFRKYQVSSEGPLFG